MNSIIAFIIVLGVLILIHELGHFITAKLAGIAVPRFSIGLGPRVWGFTVGETEYVISALPLGGYVKMAGMGEDEALEALEGGKSDLEVPPHFGRRGHELPVRDLRLRRNQLLSVLGTADRRGGGRQPG
jgi:regulator of sigma E protease